MLELCTVRSVSSEDLQMLLEWRNHPDIRRFMLTQHEISLEEHLNWYSSASQDPTQRLYIVEESQQPIGYVQFTSVTEGGVSNWGFYASPNATKGSGKKIGSVALNFAFSELKLHKVCGQAIETNLASQNFHKRLGFKQEGVLRDQHLLNGFYQSLFCYGLLAHEWQLPDNQKDSHHAKH
jgi:UDP-4-amino-4,6-dideoxy-N-acetyl-beta-L-altrosamine N-acetyltransferase